LAPSDEWPPLTLALSPGGAGHAVPVCRACQTCSTTWRRSLETSREAEKLGEVVRARFCFTGCHGHAWVGMLTAVARVYGGLRQDGRGQRPPRQAS